MFLIKIFKFLKGYVIITLRGFFIERFINICTRRNIKLWDIKKTSPSFAVIKISVSDFKKIRPVARKTHTKIKIRQKCGLKAFVSKYKSRYALFFGIFIFIISCTVLPQFIWAVDIRGCETIDKNEITALLHETGIYPGAFKHSLITQQQIRDIVMSRFDNITWAWIYINGSRAVLEIEERTPVPEITDKTQFGNIIALKDGVVSKIIVKDGVSDIIPGNAVSAGDILINGEITIKDGSKRYVHALGEVEAFTYYNETRDVKLFDELRTPTGRKKTFCTINAFSNKLNLFISPDIPFSEYDSENKTYHLPFNDKYPIPVSLSKKTVSEVTVSRLDISEKTAADRVRESIENDISKKLLPQSELINKNTYTEKIDDETIRVNVQMEFKEKIGSYQPIPDIPDNSLKTEE